MKIELPPDLDRLFRTLPVLRQAYLVGGCVRDALLGRSGEDFDIEVFGTDFETLAAALRPHGRVDLVGRSFGVVKLSLGGATHDFSLPRRDSKTGPGHRGFEIQFDASIEPREAAARRDFTLNAMMFQPVTGEMLDFFGGEADLRAGRLRHTSSAFGDDPLRVLRGMQFAGRFALQADPETVAICRGMAPRQGELPVERIREEWMKWAAGSTVPSAGLRFLADTGWLGFYPELTAIRGVPQDPEWHPEGDVWTHTLHGLDALAGLDEWRSADVSTRQVLMLALLTHDLGKAVTTQSVQREGRDRIISPGHERESVTLGGAFLERIGVPGALVERILPLVAAHMAHFEGVTERAIRRLAHRLEPETVDHLCLVMTADAFGRPPRARAVPANVTALRDLAETMKLTAASPRRLLLGRHLLALGLPAGPALGPWLDRAFEAQLDGRFETLAEAHAWLAEQEGLPTEARERARAAAQG